MQTYYIPHKIKEGDITHLADNDSIYAIKNNTHEEDVIDVQAPNGIFQAQVTYIEKASVEIEIIKKLSDVISQPNGITIIQAVSSNTKFGLFLEKTTEIGIEKVIPIISELCLIDKTKAIKDKGLWEKIIRDATEQSRNPNPPILEKTIDLKELKIGKEYLKLCFVTENIQTTDLIENVITSNQNIALAFGPESGWSFEDLEIFKKLGFHFIRLKGNILRTETTPIVVTSIIKFIQKKL